MKKTIIAILFIMGCALFPTMEANASETVTIPSLETRVTPLRIGIWPNNIIFPHNMKVYGLSLGLPVSFDDQPFLYVAGLDMALFYSKSNVKGAQMSILNMGDGSDGAQFAVVNAMVSAFNGAQFGVYNDYNSSEGFQLGLINKAINSKGVQIGLINFMDNGIFEVFPIINISKSIFSFNNL